jgi:hypothetical protein
MVGAKMRNTRRLQLLAICVVSALLASCGHGTLTQKFVNKDDSSRSLSLTRPVGLVSPASHFPANVLFKVFGTNQLEGTYVLVSGSETIKGKFVAGKDGDSQWIKFIAGGRPEWQVKVVGGELVGPDSTTWILESAAAEAKSVSTVKIGE